MPAVAALANHIGANVGQLVGQSIHSLILRPDRVARCVDRYGYDMLPRACQRFFALMLYRPEMIIPESAILGMLGVAALGFMSIAQSRTSV